MNHSSATPATGRTPSDPAQGRPGDRPAGDARGEEGGHGHRASGRGERPERNRRHRDLEPPLQLAQRHLPAAVGPERLADERSAAADDEAPVRRQAVGPGTEVDPRDELVPGRAVVSHRPSSVRPRVVAADPPRPRG